MRERTSSIESMNNIASQTTLTTLKIKETAAKNMSSAVVVVQEV